MFKLDENEKIKLRSWIQEQEIKNQKTWKGDGPIGGGSCDG